MTDEPKPTVQECASHLWQIVFKRQQGTLVGEVEGEWGEIEPIRSTPQESLQRPGKASYTRLLTHQEVVWTLACWRSRLAIASLRVGVLGGLLQGARKLEGTRVDQLPTVVNFLRGMEVRCAQRKVRQA